MSSNKPHLTREARKLILLALGSNDAEATEPIEALTLALGATHAEAEALCGDTNPNEGTLTHLKYAHAARLEALQGFFDAGYLVMRWVDTVEERAEKSAELAASRAVGLRSVPNGGAS